MHDPPATSLVRQLRQRLRVRRPSLSYVRLFRGMTSVEATLLVVGTLAALAAGVPLPLIGLFFGKMVNGFNSISCERTAMSPAERQDFLDSVGDHVVAIVIIAAVNFVLIWVYTSCWSSLGERIVRRLRERYVQALLSQDMAYFDKLPPGEISTRLSENLITVQNGTSEKVGIFLSSLAYFIASYIVAFVLLPELAAQLIALVPAFLLVSMLGAHFVSKYTGRMSAHLADALGIASEALTNLRIVQAFGAQKPLGKLHDAHQYLVRRNGLLRAVSAATMLGFLFFVAYSANALAFHSGSRMVTDRMQNVDQDATNTVGSVYTVIFLLLDASFVVGQIAPYLQTFSAAGGAGALLLDTIALPTPINALDPRGAQPAADGPLGFQLRDVRFAYPARPNVHALDSLSLDVAPGTRVGICGFSGSGKSTIVSLLHRFYEPEGGLVALDDGTPLHTLNVRWLRSQMGLVSQEPVLFDCTVLESIAHGLLGSFAHTHLHSAVRFLSRYSLDAGQMRDDWLADAPDTLRGALAHVVSLCEEAARLAQAHTFICKMPHGYLTRVGDAGRTLSGGQRQRIALARAIVKKPRVLVLDEATAALDSQSELAVQAAFDSVSVGRTTIAIAHRLSTIKHYDRIVVMAHGAVVEQGTHDELLAAQGHYARLVQAQSDAPASPDESALEQTVGLSDSAKLSDELAESVVDDDAAPASLASAPGSAPAQPVVPPSTLDDVVPHAKSPTPVQLSYTRAMGRLLRWACAKWPFALTGLAAAAVIGGAYSGEAELFGHVIEALNPCKTVDRVQSQADLFALFFFVLALIELCAYFVSGAAFGFVSEWLLLRIRKLLFRTLLSQPLAWYEERDATPATMIANLSADTSNLGGLTGTVIGTIFSILVNFAAGITLAHIVAWRIAVVIFATVPILVAAGYMRLKVIADFQKRHETVYARSTALAVEAIGAIRTVAALGRERDVIELFQHSLRRPYRDSMRHVVVCNMFLAVSLSISYFIYGFAYWWGSRNVAEERYSQVAFFIVLPALLFSAQSSGQLLAFAPDFTKAQVSASNVFSMLDSAVDRTEPRELAAKPVDLEADEKPAQPRPCGALPVTFDHVWFTYPQRTEPALRGISLDIPAGTFAAFIGESGSGKSTAMSLIESFYAPTRGTVRVAGQSTTAVPAAELRANMAIVPQEAMLFDGTIQFNVALGLADPLSVPAVVAQLDAVRRPSDGHGARAPVPVDPRVTAACRGAHVHEAIEAMPDQYDTGVGAGGAQLSGGQRQRISIARALIRTPRLLLLDESTSAMDAASEQAFQQTLNEVRRYRHTDPAVSLTHVHHHCDRAPHAHDPHGGPDLFVRSRPRRCARHARRAAPHVEAVPGDDFASVAGRVGHCTIDMYLRAAEQILLVERIVRLFNVRISEPGEKVHERRLGLGRHLDAGKHAGNVATLVPEVEEGNVPAAVEALEEALQRAGALREDEAEDALVRRLLAPADQIAPVRLDKFVLADVGRSEALLLECLEHALDLEVAQRGARGRRAVRGHDRIRLRRGHGAVQEERHDDVGIQGAAVPVRELGHVAGVHVLVQRQKAARAVRNGHGKDRLPLLAHLGTLRDEPQPAKVHIRTAYDRHKALALDAGAERCAVPLHAGDR